MKILIIGLGSIAKKHIKAITTYEPTAQIYALRSGTSLSNYDTVHNLYHLEDVFDYQFDFIIISNPTSKHRETINVLKDLNVPLFIEKPLFDNLEGYDLVKELKKKGVPTYVACNLRYLKVLRFLKQEVTKHQINEVNVYCGSYLPDWRPGTDFRKCYSANPEMGGGVHIDLIHEIDYVYWLFGMPTKVHKVFTHKSTLNIRAYDYANYILEYDTFNVNIILNYYRKDSKRTCEMVMENQTYIADLLKGTIINGNGDIVKMFSQHISDTYNEQMLDFFNRLKSRNFDFNTVEDGYNVLKICLA